MIRGVCYWIDRSFNSLSNGAWSLLGALRSRLRPPTLLGAGLLLACTAGETRVATDGIPSGQDPASDSSATDIPAGGQALFSDLEEGLLLAPRLAFRFRIAAEGAVTASLTGVTRLTEQGRVDLSAKGTFAGTPVVLRFLSDGDRMTGGSEEHAFEADVPAALREALVIGLTRMGLLHNLARLSAGSPPDHATGGVREWVRVGEVSVGREPRPAITSEFRELSFPIFVSGKRSGEATLRIDRNGLPARREQTVQFPTGMMRVVEEYEFLAPGERVFPQ